MELVNKLRSAPAQPGRIWRGVKADNFDRLSIVDDDFIEQDDEDDVVREEIDPPVEGETQDDEA